MTETNSIGGNNDLHNNNEAMMSFDNDDDDDDEMLDMFSFGAETTAVPPSTTLEINGNGINGNLLSNDTPNSMSKQVDGVTEVMKSTILPPNNCDDDDIDNKSNASEDSFLELLEQQQKETTMIDSSVIAAANLSSKQQKGNSTGINDDSDMQDILDWLDKDDDYEMSRKKRNGKHSQTTNGDIDDDDDDEETLFFVEPPRPPTLAESLPKPEPPPPLPKEYSSLEEAVKAHDSSMFQIRRLLEKEKFHVQPDVRPWLWSKVICGKTLEETLQSSIADSFLQWEQQWKTSALEQQAESESRAVQDTDNGIVSLSSSSASQPNEQEGTKMSKERRKREWLEKQSHFLAQRIISTLNDGKDSSVHQKDLLAILMNQDGTKPTDDHDGEEEEEEEDDDASWQDPLLPPVACTILSAGVPKAAAAVMLSQIISKFMPVVSLSSTDRVLPAGILHRQFYLLACYHLPLLVLHLDKYIPVWYNWPPEGQIPQSWLISHLAGEAGTETMINPQLLLSLWDLILTSSNNSLRFFLVMAVLDNQAEKLLLLTDDELKQEFHRIVNYSTKTELDSGHEFFIDSIEAITNSQASQCVKEWSDRALGLWEETPSSVTRKLKALEDEAVNNALMVRQKAKEERTRLKQEAEAKAQQEAVEAERERKADEARLRLTRARLVAFYRQHNPGKETNIDKIMESYVGRYDILDAKLKQKYGVGFNPALKPKPITVNKQNSNFLSTMNSGFGPRRNATKRNEGLETNDLLAKKESAVLEVAPSEVLPVICWSKEANHTKRSKLKKSSKLENESNQRMPLKFYLVDSRPESIMLEQGRFPTSVSLSPTDLVDMDRIKQQEEMFESLRGSVHICVMGEGYAALPRLYGHKMTNGLAEFIRQDEARINECAIFFLSRGFPFVSILEGGFAGAHAYLCREGPAVHLHAKNVLTDYDPEVSLFAQFERIQSSSGREKAQRTLQNLFDSSMTALTKNSMRLETLASELSSGNADDHLDPKAAQRNVVQRFFGGNKEDSTNARQASSTQEVSEDVAAAHGTIPFHNPFARKGQVSRDNVQTASHKNSATGSAIMESGEFVDDNSRPDTAGSSSAEKPCNQEIVSEVSPNTAQTASTQHKANAFSGLGAALNSSLKASNKSQNLQTVTTAPAAGMGLPRNPFARFGNSATNNDAKKNDGKGIGMANHFAGLNQFRKNTMARIKSTENSSLHQRSSHLSDSAANKSLSGISATIVDGLNDSEVTRETTTDTNPSPPESVIIKKDDDKADSSKAEIAKV